MRLFIAMLTIALLAAWVPVAPAPATAQECDPDVCANPWANKGKSAKAKAKANKQSVAKRQKKPAKEQFMRIAP